MGPFMVEIVFCRVTRRGRKKGKGMNKLARENMRNDGPMQSFIPKDDMLKVTLDLSDNGPVFSALDEMMLKLSMEGADEARKNKKKGGDDAKKALKNLLRSGIPGIEGMLGAETPEPRFGKKGGKKGFHKMNEGSKKKFMTAIFGEDGAQIDSSTAAALLATTCSAGNPDVGNRLAELLVPNMGETVDPAMMGALMSACSLINAGAGTEEVMKAMLDELAASGMSEEEILEKTQILMKAFGKEDTASTAEYKLLSKQKNVALKNAGISPKDFTAVMLAHKAIAASGTTPENVAKVFIIESTLAKKGANPQHIAQAMLNLGQISDEVKAEVKENILASWNQISKLGKTDVGCPVRMHQALDNENEPTWVECKNLKDITGGCSPNSQEAIELNLARATKSGGLKKDDIGRANMALKAISLLGVDPVQVAKVLFLEKTICANGVPAVEVARVLSDGLMPAEACQGLIDEVADRLTEDHKAADIDSNVKVYNNLKFKSNLLGDVVDYVDKTLIQVRCSLEDVADNMISTMRARGEKDMKITLDVIETLKKTGASASVVGATVLPPLRELTNKKDTELTKVIGRNLKEVDFSSDDVKGAVTEMILKIIEEDPSQHQDACASLEAVFKDLGEFPNTIKDFIASNLPPPPTPPEEIERRLKLAEELERLTREEEERERLKAEKAARGGDDEEEEEEYEMGKPRNKKLDAVMNGDGSRRGSLLPPPARSRQGSITIGGLERRGSYYDDGVTTRATVAVVTDDPEHKKNLKKTLSGVFNDDGKANPSVIDPTSTASGGVGVGGKGGRSAGAGADGGGVGRGGAVAGAAAGAGGGDGTGVTGPTGSAQTSAILSEIVAAAGTSGEMNGHSLPPGMEAVLNSLPENATEAEIAAAMAAAGVSMDPSNPLMAAVYKGVSEESRALMQQILASNSSQDEISSRVAALLAGTALSTSRGDKTANLRGDVKMEQYDIGNLDLSARKRTDDFTMPDIPDIEIDGVRSGRDYSGSRRTGTAENGYDVSSGSVRRRKYYTASQGEDDSSSVNMRGASLDLMRAKRGSIKRQSELLRESRKKAQEREEERQRKRSYYRQIAGLRKAKVPMMVYSCGGFSRCFRVARYYDVEGPPVGVVFERPEDERRSLNPDL